MLLPKQENKGRGYFYNVTEEEIKQHVGRSTEDVFYWIESTNRFVSQLQTDHERKRSQLCKII